MFAVTLAYPIIDFVTITVGVLVLIRAKGSARLSVALLLAGVVLMAVSNGVFFHLLVHGAYRRGDLIDAGWVTVAVVVRVGGARRRVRSSAPTAVR